ncbi:putative signal peptide protein [Puccinia sorghi]|uniref:Putative signal peptide protein n=1 Tax=Puccinia sorghi TaxID=27349 RepID=A0A0L6VE89_9BASI|nr:putative signal peptide protein [Puccinia sorghi]
MHQGFYFFLLFVFCLPFSLPIFFPLMTSRQKKKKKTPQTYDCCCCFFFSFGCYPISLYSQKESCLIGSIRGCCVIDFGCCLLFLGNYLVQLLHRPIGLVHIGIFITTSSIKVSYNCLGYAKLLLLLGCIHTLFGVDWRPHPPCLRCQLVLTPLYAQKGCGQMLTPPKMVCNCIEDQESGVDGCGGPLTSCGACWSRRRIEGSILKILTSIILMYVYGTLTFHQYFWRCRGIPQKQSFCNIFGTTPGFPCLMKNKCTIDIIILYLKIFTIKIHHNNIYPLNNRKNNQNLKKSNFFSTPEKSIQNWAGPSPTTEASKGENSPLWPSTPLYWSSMGIVSPKDSKLVQKASIINEHIYFINFYLKRLCCVPNIIKVENKPGENFQPQARHKQEPEQITHQETRGPHFASPANLSPSLFSLSSLHHENTSVTCYQVTYQVTKGPFQQVKFVYHIGLHLRSLGLLPKKSENGADLHLTIALLSNPEEEKENKIFPPSLACLFYLE